MGHLKLRSGLTALALMAGVLGPVGAAMSAPASAQAASVTTLYVVPGAAAGGTGTSQLPFATIDQAEQAAHQDSASSDVVVDLAAGTYRLTQPLTFTSADSGQNGHAISYAAPAGQTAVVTGAQQVTGWTVQNQANNIWVAQVGTGVNTRQLYVNGAEAPRAAIQVPRSDFTFTQTGLTITNSSLSYLAGLTDQNQIEVESVNSFTDRYAPVQSISGSTIVMQQPAWDNNTWGYDTMNAPFVGGTMYLENNYSFLQQAGQWYLDSATGQLFYKAQSGQNPSSLDIELPRLQNLLDVSGSYSNPVSGLTFSNTQFSGTTWLGPSGSTGYADQQNGAHITNSYQMPSNWLSTCSSGCTQFEATRNQWAQIPAAVQVSAATSITFSGDTADGIVAGGVQPDAHHPSNPAMTNQNITISNNRVTNVGTDYKE